MNTTPRAQLLHPHLAVVRYDGRRYWLLNHREKGWASYGFWFASLAAMEAAVAIRVLDAARDEHGPYLRVGGA